MVDEAPPDYTNRPPSVANPCRTSSPTSSDQDDSLIHQRRRALRTRGGDVLGGHGMGAPARQSTPAARPRLHVMILPAPGDELPFVLIVDNLTDAQAAQLRSDDRIAQHISTTTGARALIAFPFPVDVRQGD
jgi:hypothetical protein